MTGLTELVRETLPALRRMARILTGRTDVADAYVQAVLELVLADRSLLLGNLPPRPALFRLLLQSWNARPAVASMTSSNASSPSARVASLPLQAFLLIHVEGFSRDDAASIMGVGLPELLELLDRAGLDLTEQMLTTVLIIEDDPLIAFDLERIVAANGHEVQATARNMSEAIRACHLHEPGLILADVKLEGAGSGIDVVNLLTSERRIPVVFITAYPERLLAQRMTDPILMVAKPFSDQDVQRMITQALFFELSAMSRISPAHFA